MKPKISPTIAVTVNGGAWTRVLTLRNAKPDDRVYTLNRDDGTITFGDGTHGRMPPVGATVSVSYRLGAGSAGNVAKRIDNPSSLTKFWVFARRSQQAIGWGNRRC
jgi:hypothetical protein